MASSINQPDTSQGIIIRPERLDDAPEISRVTKEAFRGHLHSSHTEQFIVDALRRAGALTVSLVAERGGRVIGHIAFSPVQLSDDSPHWYGLGPISVIPEMQGLGIGSALVNAGLDLLRASGAEGCVVVGEPGFYARFGFRSRPECVFEGVPQEYVQSLAFGQRLAAGCITYHDAFGAMS